MLISAIKGHFNIGSLWEQEIKTPVNPVSDFLKLH